MTESPALSERMVSTQFIYVIYLSVAFLLQREEHKVMFKIGIKRTLTIDMIVSFAICLMKVISKEVNKKCGTNTQIREVLECHLMPSSKIK